MLSLKVEKNVSSVSNPHISVVIPVYKAEHCLNELYQRLRLSLESITSNFEIILVEDCGGDNSWRVIEHLAAQDDRVKGLQFSRNFGQHYGITAGIDFSSGDWVIVMDCDLQDRPEEIPNLYKKAQEGFDIVLANRGQRNDPVLKKITSWLYYSVFNYLSDMKYDGRIGNFRIISRNVVINFCSLREQLRFFGGLIQWMGYPTAMIDVQHDDRHAGKTSYTFGKLWKLAIETIIAYSDKPLRLCIRLGFLLSSLSFAYGGYIAYRSMVYGVTISGWSSLIVSLYFLGGIIICLLGMLGVYLGKTFDEVKKRPLYIIRKFTSNFSS